MRLGELGERGMLARLRARRADAAGVVVGIGDDAAIVRGAPDRLTAITVDTLVEGVDFHLSWGSPGELGAKLATVNLSDLAAMGATPRHAVLSAALRSTLEEQWWDGLLDGVVDQLARHGAALVGGDLSSIDGPLVLTLTAVGELAEGSLARRDGGRPRDRLCVTGTLGEAAAGLRLLQATPGEAGGPVAASAAERALIDALLRPRPQVEEGGFLAGRVGLHALIDVSDGLARDLRNLAEASRLGARVELARLPVSEALGSVAAARGWDPLELALGGGEDFCLLAAIDPAHHGELAEAFSRRFGRPLVCVGELAEGDLLIARDGAWSPLGDAGFQHFAAPPTCYNRRLSLGLPTFDPKGSVPEMNTYELEHFVQEMNTLFVEERPARQFLETAAECVRKLVSGSLYLDERRMRPTDGKPFRHVLYRDPADNYTLLCVAWPPGYETPVHDHGTWGVMVGYRARVIVTTWRRLDEGTDEKVAQLNEVARQLVSEGGITSLIRPPEEEIHRVENPFQEIAITIHAVGENRPWPHLYDTETGAISPAGEEHHAD